MWLDLPLQLALEGTTHHAAGNKDFDEAVKETFFLLNHTALR